MHIFISYAKKDTRELALKLYDELNKLNGISAWMDKSLQPAASWVVQIEEEIQRADYIIVLVSPDINRIKTETQDISFVRKEIDFGQQLHKPIIPILAQPTYMPVQLAGIQYIDIVNNSDKGLSQLFQFILQNTGINQILTEKSEILCPYCYQYTVSKDNKTCTYCGRKIPLGYIRSYVNGRLNIVAPLGLSQHGKSMFLENLIFALGHLPKKPFEN